MKVQKTNIKHWSYLLRAGLVVATATAVKNIFNPRSTDTVIMYGHTFNGNLLALAGYIKENKSTGINCYYATIDPDYYDELKSSNPSAQPLSLIHPSSIMILARAGVVVTDRQAHVLEWFNRWTKVPFVDVWHGIPFKGFVPHSFAYLQKYEEIWTTSESIRKIYIDRFKLPAKKVVATGYARTDVLVNATYDVRAIKKRYDLEGNYKKIVLVAPTWQQDDKGRSIIPFGISENQFFEEMEKIGEATNTLFIFRAHLNVKNAASFKSLDYVKNMPYALYPEVEDFLAISDVLVTDWSSICFDFMPLGRPVIFLDVPPPFKDDFTVGPEYRAGLIASDLDTFVKGLYRAIDNPTTFLGDYKEKISAAMKLVYGDKLDGQVTKRQLVRLKQLLRK